MAGAAGGLIVGSRVLGAGPLAGLGIAGGLLLAFALAWVRARGAAIEVSRRIIPTRLHAGGEGRVLLEGSALAATPLLTLTDHVDGGRRAARFIVAPRHASARLRAAYRIPTPRRGRRVVGPLVATVADPLGLARRSWVLAGPTDIVICPRVHDVVAPGRGGGGEPAANAEGTRSAAVETLGEFLALRAYEPGDDPRRVSWRATARTGELVVRQDEAASPGRVVVMLDVRPERYDAASFEVAVEAVASLAVRLRRDHIPVEVVTTTGEVLARAGPGAVELLLDRLAVVEVGGANHLAALCVSLRNRLGVGAVVTITGSGDRTLIDALSLLRSRRTVTLVATRRGLPPLEIARAGIVLIDAADRPFAKAWNETTGRRSVRAHRPAAT
jgi:uncharacterized protein (DUF58 family)